MHLYEPVRSHWLQTPKGTVPRPPDPRTQPDAVGSVHPSPLHLPLR